MQSELVKPKTTFGSQIKFTPYAWAKLLYMRDRGGTEVAGYGVTGTEDPLLVTDFVLVKQECTIVTFDLDAADSAEYMEKMMDKGLMPWQYANILIHTHPGDSPSPSGVDEKNFISAFSHPNWAIMFIIAEGGACYCRLKVNVGPGSVVELKTIIEWNTKFDGTNIQAWEEEYQTKVVEQHVASMRMTGKEGKKGNIANHFQRHDDDLYTDFSDPLWHNKQEQQYDRLGHIDQDELDRLGEEAYKIDDEIDFDCHWDSNGDVAYWDQMTCEWYFFDPMKNQWYVEKEDDDTIVTKIDTPKKEWVQRVVDWAIQFADERVVEEVVEEVEK